MGRKEGSKELVGEKLIDLVSQAQIGISFGKGSARYTSGFGRYRVNGLWAKHEQPPFLANSVGDPCYLYTS
jgi:hypothetical protein